MIKNINGVLKKIDSKNDINFFKTPAGILAKGEEEISIELGFVRALNNYVKKSLGEELSSYISYCSLKNNTLFIVFTHPAALSLYRLKEKEFLDNLRCWYQDFKRICPKAYWKQVRAKLKAELPIIKKHPVIINQKIPERATGEFEILCKDEKLKSLFASIKDNVRLAQRKQQSDNKEEMEANVSIDLSSEENKLV